MQEQWVSLRKAARESGLSRDELRRRVISGDLPAVPVDDARLYLVRLSDVTTAPNLVYLDRRPGVDRRFLWSVLGAAAAVLVAVVCISSVEKYQPRDQPPPARKALSIKEPVEADRRQRLTRGLMHWVASRIEFYREDTGHYPRGLEDLYLRPMGESDWRGPYVYGTADYNDMWDRPFHYRSPGIDGCAFSLESLGAAGWVGGQGMEADLVYRAPARD